ncbi:MAG: helix-turn-helix transcriptional regulator [Clostridia bacterium]|nr:helix-turn-helix transcriptional regulator [Clostridia bacterium]
MGIITNYSTANGDIYFHHTVSEKTQGTPPLYGPESHRGFEMIYLVEGEVRYFIEGEEYLARTGDLIFILPNEIHALQRSGAMKYERVVVSFEYNTVREMLERCGFCTDKSFLEMKNTVHRIIPIDLVEKYGIKEIMRDIGELDSTYSEFPFKFLSSVMSLIAALNKLFSNESREPVFRVSSDPVVKSAVDFIGEHITEQITLERISERLHVSKSTLCHRFRDSMNTSVNRYVAIKKIYHAMRLMENGMSATEAAAAVGYEHYTTFYHNYKQIIGVSPANDKK